MLDYRRLCRGRRENGEANKRKNGVSCSTGISLLVFFFFFNSDRYRYRFFPPSFPLSCPVLFADLLSVFLLFRLCQVNIEI